MKNGGKLRLSYSLLLLWSQGRQQEAVDLYLHKDVPKTEAMEDGISHHKKWADSIKTLKTLTLGTTTLNFNTPEVESKRMVVYSDHYDLSGTFDCLDGEVLYEFKSGVISSVEYGDGYQLPFYFLIGELSKIPIEKGIVVHYNQHIKKTDITLVWNTSRQIEKARNFIDSLAPEVEVFFRKEGIIK